MSPAVPGKPHMDASGKAYVAFTAIWLAVVFWGVWYLFHNRRHAAVRHRDISLTLAAIGVLNIIAFFDFIQYPTNGTMPCQFEFWVYSLCFPLGVLLFQAKNFRIYVLYFLQLNAFNSAIAKAQPDSAPSQTWMSAFTSARRRLRLTSGRAIQKFLWRVVYVMMGVHLFMTVVVFSASSRWNPRGPVKGSQISDPDEPCHKGWEWYPKHASLILYAYVLGPILLFLTRKIEDTHFMRVELIATILVSVPAFPLFMVAYLTNAMSAIDSQFPPLMWFNPSIMIMTLVSIFLPFYEINRYKRRQTSEDSMLSMAPQTLVGVNISADFAAHLNDRNRFAAFKRFCVDDLSVENPLFIESVMAFKALVSKLQARGTSTTRKAATGDLGNGLNTATVEIPASAFKNASSNPYDRNSFPGSDEYELKGASPHGKPSPALIPNHRQEETYMSMAPPRDWMPGDIDRVRQAAKDIFEAFLLPNSPMEVNVRAATSRAMRDAYAAEAFYGPEMFDEVVAELLVVMYQDTWPRFRESKYFKDLQVQMQKPKVHAVFGALRSKVVGTHGLSTV